MATAYGRIPTKGNEYKQNDLENRKRVATYVDGNPFAYEDTNFTSGKDQSVINFFADSGRIAHRGWFINDGAGDIKIAFSNDGVSYGGNHTIKQGEQVDLTDFTIEKILLTYVADSAYRCLLM